MSDLAKSFKKSWRAHLKSEASSAPDISLGVVSNFTLDPIVPFIGGGLLSSNFSHPQIKLAEYDQIIQACLNPTQAFGAVDTIVVLWRIEDLTADITGERLEQSAEMILSSFEQLRDNFDGTIIIGLPPRPRSKIDGLGGFSRPSSLIQVWQHVSSKLTDLSFRLSKVYLIDLEAIIARLGEDRALDYRNELLYRQPMRTDWYFDCAQAVIRIARLAKSEPKKCLVLDCDNTIWGGVVGEDGVGGIQLSDDMPGYAFRQFQRQALELRKSGVFVALNSKNNPEAVWAVFDENDAMVLTRNDIASARINWRPKSENLKEIAKELNIGLDSLVFMDDSSFECEEVRAHAPEVTVVQIPEDSAELPLVMAKTARLFDRLDITADDLKRVDMIRLEGQRRDLRQKMTEDEFLATLGLEVFLYPPAESDKTRVTQLVNKTNQFNVTTQRYTLGEIEAKINADDHDVFCATVRDKFGDYGLVGVAILKTDTDTKEAHFDTLLMSCRVLGRGIETAIIEHAKHLAKNRNLKTVSGTYIPTAKNQMVADIYSRHGFTEIGSGSDEVQTHWSSASEPSAVPAYLSVNLDRPS